MGMPLPFIPLVLHISEIYTILPTTLQVAALSTILKSMPFGDAPIQASPIVKLPSSLAQGTATLIPLASLTE
ncbi:hypothetical protein ES703_84707 [subsurface metagenome]